MTDFVELERFDTPAEADLARLYLESEGVEAVLFDAGLNSMGRAWMLVPVRLMVFDDDVERARKLMCTYHAKEDGKSGPGRSPPWKGSQ